MSLRPSKFKLIFFLHPGSGRVKLNEKKNKKNEIKPILLKRGEHKMTTFNFRKQYLLPPALLKKIKHDSSKRLARKLSSSRSSAKTCV